MLTSLKSLKACWSYSDRILAPFVLSKCCPDGPCQLLISLNIALSCVTMFKCSVVYKTITLNPYSIDLILALLGSPGSVWITTWHMDSSSGQGGQLEAPLTHPASMFLLKQEIDQCSMFLITPLRSASASVRWHVCQKFCAVSVNDGYKWSNNREVGF